MLLVVITCCRYLGATRCCLPAWQAMWTLWPVRGRTAGCRSGQCMMPVILFLPLFGGWGISALGVCRRRQEGGEQAACGRRQGGSRPLLDAGGGGGQALLVARVAVSLVVCCCSRGQHTVHTGCGEVCDTTLGRVYDLKLWIGGWRSGPVARWLIVSGACSRAAAGVRELHT